VLYTSSYRLSLPGDRPFEFIVDIIVCPQATLSARARDTFGIDRSSATHVKISHLVPSCQQAVNKLCSHCLSQVVNKFGTSC
jgi:hypothetical protein